jgi:hypothetical protein
VLHAPHISFFNHPNITRRGVQNCWSYFAQWLLEWEIFQTKIVEKFETYFHFFFENHAFHEIMWENIVQPERPKMTIWCMRIACRIPKATNTHPQC